MSNNNDQPDSDAVANPFTTSRRQFAGWIGGSGLLALAGCGSSGGLSPSQKLHHHHHHQRMA